VCGFVHLLFIHPNTLSIICICCFYSEMIRKKRQRSASKSTTRKRSTGDNENGIVPAFQTIECGCGYAGGAQLWKCETHLKQRQNSFSALAFPPDKKSLQGNSAVNDIHEKFKLDNPMWSNSTNPGAIPVVFICTMQKNDLTTPGFTPIRHGVIYLSVLRYISRTEVVCEMPHFATLMPDKVNVFTQRDKAWVLEYISTSATATLPMMEHDKMRMHLADNGMSKGIILMYSRSVSVCSREYMQRVGDKCLMCRHDKYMVTVRSFLPSHAHGKKNRADIFACTACGSMALTCNQHRTISSIRVSMPTDKMVTNGMVINTTSICAWMTKSNRKEITRRAKLPSCSRVYQYNFGRWNIPSHKKSMHYNRVPTVNMDDETCFICTSVCDGTKRSYTCQCCLGKMATLSTRKICPIVRRFSPFTLPTIPDAEASCKHRRLANPSEIIIEAMTQEAFRHTVFRDDGTVVIPLRASWYAAARAREEFRVNFYIVCKFKINVSRDIGNRIKCFAFDRARTGPGTRRLQTLMRMRCAADTLPYSKPTQNLQSLKKTLMSVRQTHFLSRTIEDSHQVGKVLTSAAGYVLGPFGPVNLLNRALDEIHKLVVTICGVSPEVCTMRKTIFLSIGKFLQVVQKYVQVCEPEHNKAVRMWHWLKTKGLVPICKEVVKDLPTAETLILN